MAFGSPQWMYSAGPEDQDFGYSLRFNDNDSPYLSRTFASGGNQKTWTWSGWVKRANLGTQQRIFSGGVLGQNSVELFFPNSTYGPTDSLWIGIDGNSTYVHANTTRLFRDTSSWYHITFVLDTTQSVATNRVKLYINNELIPSADFTHHWASAWTSITQNSDRGFNNNGVHGLGARNNFSESLDGYLAEVHFIDGTALTPSSFGETGTYGEWKPKTVSGLTYGTNGFYLSFAGGGIMTATGGNSTATDGSYKAASFTANGTFTPSADGYVEYLVIAGGGGGGSNSGSDEGGGGGGAGGYRTGFLAVTASTAYSITVGGAGLGRANGAGAGGDGSNSVFSTITSIGGGGGGATDSDTARSGGSGGGMGSLNSFTAGAGTAGQGNAGGTGNGWHGGGGGGAGQVGGDYNPPNGTDGDGGNGGNGLASSITGSSVTRAGGGGAGTWNSASYTGQSPGTGGSGGGGAGGATNQGAGSAGTVNTGGGGGGAGNNLASGAGGSGIVIVRYKFQ